MSTGTDTVGDANVFTNFDQNWCVDLRGTNVLGVNGPVQAYAPSVRADRLQRAGQG